MKRLGLRTGSCQEIGSEDCLWNDL